MKLILTLCLILGTSSAFALDAVVERTTTVARNTIVATESDLTTLADSQVRDFAYVESTGEIWTLWNAPANNAANWLNLTSKIAGGGDGAVSAIDDIAGLRAELDAKAPVSNPLFAGHARVPTRAVADVAPGTLMNSAMVTRAMNQKFTFRTTDLVDGVSNLPAGNVVFVY